MEILSLTKKSTNIETRINIPLLLKGKSFISCSKFLTEQIGGMGMRKIVGVLVFVIVLALVGCATEEEEVAVKHEDVKKQQITVVEKIIALEEEEALLNIVVPQIKGMMDREEQDRINQQFVTLGKELETETNETEANMSDEPLFGVEMHAEGTMEYEVKLLNDNLISILIEQYTFSGGAHGSTRKFSFNYDLRKGEEIRIDDLLVTGDYNEVFISLIAESIIESEIEWAFIIEIAELKDDQDFYITDDSLVFCFDQYEYTASAVGSPEISVRIEKVHDLVGHIQ